jgi:acetyl esterase
MRAECSSGSGRPEPVAEVRDMHAGGVPARLYRPAGGESDVLVWLHGGAWMTGDPDCCDAAVRALANRAGCAVLSVDYRLAPEHRYPAAVEDCWAAAGWAARNFDFVAVGGDSAGGNLSAAVALRARDDGISLALQLLVYPVLDYRPDSPFYQEFRDRYRGFAGIGEFGKDIQENIRHIWEVYIPDPARRGERDASPLRAESFSGLAPAMVITAEHDILRGEGQDYARRLQAAGVPTEIFSYTGQVHGFFHLLAMTQDARDAVERSGAALRRAFSSPGRPGAASNRQAQEPM